jgi:superfamily II DNA helicase RecQ
MWYEKLYLYKKSKEIFLDKDNKIYIHTIKVNTISKYFKKTQIEQDNELEINQEIYTRLVEKRNEIAKEKKLPSYCVLNNKVLENISKYQPKNYEDLLKIKGIGKEKINQYGDIILEYIN